jgi:hypothetical protein
MITDEDRRFAYEQSQIRNQFHVDRGDYDKQISTIHDGAESHRRGILGECEFVNTFGGAVDIVLREHGDHRDFLLMLMTNSGVAQHFNVDVKTSSYSGIDQYLRVPVRDIKPKTIYVAARYNSQSDDIELLGWDWGSAIIALNCRKTFNQRGVENFVKPIEELRNLDELKERIVDRPVIEETDWADLLSRIEPNVGTSTQLPTSAKPDPITESEQTEPAPRITDSVFEPLLTYCQVCGKSACFGFGVSLRTGKLGRWYCGLHRHLAPEFRP